MTDRVEPGPLLSRYLAGEHEAVWAEMTALGPRVREAPYFDDAWAVARETMRRARHNVELIIRRLDQIGYQFWNGQQGKPGPQPLRMMLGGQVIEHPSLEAAVKHALQIDLSQIPAGMGRPAEQARDHLAKLSKMALPLLKQQAERQAEERQRKAEITDHLKDEDVFAPPTKEEVAAMRNLEKKGLVLPLSLRAWAEGVGDVNLAGAHPSLCFWEDAIDAKSLVMRADFPGIYADPLMVSLNDLMFESEAWLEAEEAGEDPGTMEPVLGWDAEAKARLAVEDEQLDYGYTMALPNAAADAALDGEPHKTTFVNYLRIAFRWGGFPGWERQDSRPDKELKFLGDGLLPI